MFKIFGFIIPTPEDIKSWCRDYGYGNGYVVIDKSHPAYGQHYDKIHGSIDIHGGLTYSGNFKELLSCGASPNIVIENPESYWVFGFDTRHSGDNPIDENKQYVREQVISLIKQLEAM